MPDGDEGQPGLQEATMDSLNNETPKNIENLLHKNFEYLLAQQQEATLKQQQNFLTNLQSILISSPQTHSMVSSGSSRQGINDVSAGFSRSSRQGTSTMPLNINQYKSHHHQAGNKRKHLSDDESYDDDDDDDDDDQLSVTVDMTLMLL